MENGGVWVGFPHSYTPRSYDLFNGGFVMSKESDKDQSTNEFQMATRLLSPEEEQSCSQLATGDPPWSQRAQVLLSINKGASETVASERSGLRTTQVRYWLNKYQKMGMAIFPTEMLQGIDEATTIAAESTPDGSQQMVDEAGQDMKSKKAKKAKDKKKKDKKKKNKAKRGKRSKKVKKAKSGKKKK
jgi:hypothetical protein